MSAVEPHPWTDQFDRAVVWYRDVLGFEVEAWFPDENAPTWCRMGRGEARLMIAAAPDPEDLSPTQSYLADIAPRVGNPGPLSLYLHVDDADIPYGIALDQGAEVIEEIWDAWWSGRQFTVADPDGNWWTVFRATDG